MTAEMNKSKQEVFDELQKAYPTSIPVFKAMDSWARQVSIAFAEWMDDNHYVRDKTNKDESINGKWYKISGVTEGKLNLTSSELQNLFLSQYNKEGQ